MVATMLFFDDAVGRGGCLIHILMFVLASEEHVGVEVDVESADGAVVVGIHQDVVGAFAPFGAVGVDALFECALVIFVHVHQLFGVAVGGDSVVDFGYDGVMVVDLPVDSSGEVCADASPFIIEVSFVAEEFFAGERVSAELAQVAPLVGAILPFFD